MGLIIKGSDCVSYLVTHVRNYPRPLLIGVSLSFGIVGFYCIFSFMIASSLLVSQFMSSVELGKND